MCNPKKSVVQKIFEPIKLMIYTADPVIRRPDVPIITRKHYSNGASRRVALAIMLASRCASHNASVASC